MLKIGGVSVLSQISIYMLRHYNDIELLIPEYIDGFTGYRYYSERQLPIVNRIQALRSMGLSLSLIKEILTKYEENDIKSLLEDRAAEQREKINFMQKQLKLIETTIQKLDRPSTIPLYSVALKVFPRHNVISYRKVIPSYDSEGKLWEELARQRKSQNIEFTNPLHNKTIFYNEGFAEKDIDVEIQQAVIGEYHDTDTIKFKTVEAFTAATLTFKGQYIKLSEANEEIVRWITDNNYKLSDHLFNIYHVSPRTETIPENFITEVCFPVEPK